MLAPSVAHLFRRLVSDRTACLGLVIISGVVAVALSAPLLAPYDPLEITGRGLEGPSRSHWLGTDGVGRDLLSRIIFGARLSLGSACVAGVLVLTIGLFVGALSGYVGGLLDTVLMRLVDVILAFPGLILALAISGLMEPSLLAVLLGLVSIWWVGYARVIRGLVLAVKEREFIEAARSAGAGNVRIVVRHILPHVFPPLIVLLTLEIGSLILAISGLNFLGIGAQPPTPEWGAMLAEGRKYFFSHPRIIVAPGVAISLTVLGLNLLGDGLRDVLDPRLAAAPLRVVRWAGRHRIESLSFEQQGEGLGRPSESDAKVPIFGRPRSMR